MEFTTTRADGTRCWFEANGQPVRVDHELQWGVVTIRDITDRSLRRLQDEFIAIAGHELRTPLTALSGYLQMLSRRAASTGDERSRGYAAIALEQARRLESLVTELLDVSDRIRQMVLDRRPGAEIKQAAREEGMTFLRESALEKVFAGVTTLREINKVTFVEVA